VTPEARAAEVWRIRERTEREAAALFARLASDLAESGGPEPLAALAARCADDERVHAEHCRAIIAELAPGLGMLDADERIALGPRDASAARRALYASVALGCVTESLSTALLLELRPRAELPVVRRALDVILEDEVRHSRLGWAHLALAASRGDVGWIAPFVPAMIDAALDAERPVSGPGEGGLARYGILDREDAARICRATIESTIRPGLARFGAA
jgi:hypothetical protein